MIPLSQDEPVLPAQRSSVGSSEILELEEKVERLLIVTEALWNILREKLSLEEQELVRRMVQIDLRDGKLDGRVAPSPPQQCPKCNRTLPKGKSRCMFCGEPIPPRPFAR